jgi:hypothetical protein
MEHEDALAALLTYLDEHDCLLIADALEAIDPDDHQDTERAVALADAFRRATVLNPAPHPR